MAGLTATEDGRRPPFQPASPGLEHAPQLARHLLHIDRLALAEANFRAVDTWTDPAELFSVHYFRLG
jgi:hypothetical protein